MNSESKPLFSILHATARLPWGWVLAYWSWCQGCSGIPAEYLVSMEKRDWERHERVLSDFGAGVDPIPVRFIVQSERSGSCVANWNEAARHAKGKIFCLAEDDLIAPKNWDADILATLSGRLPGSIVDSEFILEVSTGRERDGELIANAMMSRKLYERWGYFYWPEYESMYADDDLTAHARLEDVVIDARHIRFQHRPMKDQVRARQNRQEAYQLGRRIFDRRIASNFRSHVSLAIKEGDAQYSSTKTRSTEHVEGAPKPPRSIALCLSGDDFRGAWVDGILELYAHLIGKGYDVIKLRGYTSNVYVTREEIRMAVMAAPKPDLLLWLDDDNICTPQHFEQLLEDLDSRPDVDGIFGWCWIHTDDKTGFTVSCGNFSPDGSGWIPFHPSFANGRELIPVEASGFPCVLMHYSALEKAGNHPFIRGILDERLTHGIGGEDFAFMRAAMDGGAKFLVDPLVRVPHLKYVTVEPVTPVEGKAPVKIAVMMRVKNEARWIQRVIQSVRQLGSIYVMNDDSTDGTNVLAYEMGAIVYISPFIGGEFDEVRDKNWLLEKVRLDNPDWILFIDGDEELAEGGVEKIRRACESNQADVFSIPILTLWDRPDQVRVDGGYLKMARMSLFRVIPGMKFKSAYQGQKGANQKLHVPNAPLDGPEEETLRRAHLQAFILHYGSLLKEDRLRKWEWYKAMDPDNEGEDGYRHTVQGDVPEVPADAVLRHGGPLELRKLPRSLQPKNFDFESLEAAHV